MKTKNRQPEVRREQGVVIIFCLVVLAVMLAGAAAVMRSMDASLVSSGNLAFKRDLVNQGEQTISAVLTRFRTGTLSSAAATANGDSSTNYSAIQLVTNAQGIPMALLNPTTTGPDVAGNTFTGSAAAVPGVTPDVTIRFVIDRLCNATGTGTVLGEAGCVRPNSASEVRGGTAAPTPPLPADVQVVYRLSMRVDGPRGTQVFLQSSFSKPD